MKSARHDGKATLPGKDIIGSLRGFEMLFLAVSLVVALAIFLAFTAILPLAAATSATWGNLQPSGWINSLPAHVSTTVSDSDGFQDDTAKYRLTKDGGATWEDWTRTGLLVSGNGTGRSITVGGLTLRDSADANRIQFRILNGGGITQTSPIYIMRVDATPPGAPFNLQPSPTGWSSTNDFALDWTNPADTSGIAGAYYKLDGEPASPSDGTWVPGDGVHHVDGITVPAPGKHSIYLWLKDKAGNSDPDTRNVKLNAFWYDPIPPTTTLTISGTPGNAGWYVTPVTGTLHVVEIPSGDYTSTYRIDGGGWHIGSQWIVSTEGYHTVDYHSTDAAGNVEPIHTMNLGVDTIPPHTDYSVTPARTSDGWIVEPITITLSGFDGGSGIAATRYQINGGTWMSGTVIPLDGEGTYTVTFASEDVAGNREAPQSLSFRMDTTPPVTAYYPTGQEGDNGWFRSPVSITLVPSDNGSGVASTFYRVDGGPWHQGTGFLLGVDGIHTLQFYSVDNAGNQETGYPVTIKIDSKPPGSPLALNITPGGWSNTNDFTITWASPSDLSGIAGAYYKLDDPPTAPDDGNFVASDHIARRIQVPGDGVHSLYLWLRDNAGNVTHMERGFLPHAFWYDSTPPTTGIHIDGVAGDNGWYRSFVTVTLPVTDVLSGAADTFYRLDGGSWRIGNAFYLREEGKHTLDYYSVDHAGNQEPIHPTVLRVDTHAPGKAINLTIQPTGWTNRDDFSIHWEVPLDISGIGGAYIKLDSPPRSDRDGAFFVASTDVPHFSTGSEGSHDLYFWLADQAGNSDASTAIHITHAMSYDGTPPQGTPHLDGPAGENGWFKGNVGATIAYTDPVSGVSSTWLRLDGSPWVPGAATVIYGDGVHHLSFYGIDQARNISPEQTITVAIDSKAPVARFSGFNTSQKAPLFPIHWQGFDPPPGSGISGYDVQVRHGWTGPWEDYLLMSKDNEVFFYGERGHSYSFRLRAHDTAGNVQPWTAPAFTLVQPVQNGDFETGNFLDWTVGGRLMELGAVVPITSTTGGQTLAGRLGSPDYGPGVRGVGYVPVGRGAITQTITVPSLNELAKPQLFLRYRMFTYDVMWSNYYKRYYDTFEVHLIDQNGHEAVPLIDGYQGSEYATLHDLGWKEARVDLTPYAGQQIQVVLANYNRWDNRFNTWTYVDDVKVINAELTHKTFLPLAAGAASVAAASSSEESGRTPIAAHPVEGKPLR